MIENEKRYKISVIVPVYNGERFIADTVKTLQSSSAADKIRIVLVNDGSSDNSRDVMEDLALRYDNIITVNKTNGGIASARNAGLAAATEEYVCFCDQDDVVEPEMYEKLLTKIEDSGCDLVFCGTHKYIEGQKIPLETFEDRSYNREEIYSDIIHSIMFYGTDLGRPISERWVGSIWKGIYRRDIISKNDISFRRHYNYEDDLLFFIEYAVNCVSAASLSYSGYGWRINPKSETHNWKYIEDFTKKYNDFVEDITSLISKAAYSQDDIADYRRHLMCQFLIQSVTNEGSGSNKISFRGKIGHMRQVRKLLTRDDITFRKHIVRSYRRQRWGLFFMEYNMTVAAYFWLVGTRKIREGGIRKK